MYTNTHVHTHTHTHRHVCIYLRMWIFIHIIVYSYTLFAKIVEPIADRVAHHLENISKNFRFSTKRTRILMGLIFYYLVLIVNPMGGILVCWKSFKMNLEIQGHPICNQLYMCVRMCICAYVCVYVHTYVYMCIRMCICIPERFILAFRTGRLL